MPVNEPIVYNSVEEWLAEGERLFGPDRMNWKFVCPMCGNVQSVQEFKQLAEEGHRVTPDSARFNCIGRYKGGRSAFLDDGKDGPPCDYTTGGLFNVSPVKVAAPDGEHWAFDFYRNEETYGNHHP